MDLNECWARLRSGEREAFAALYHQYKQPVFTIACRMVHSRSAAEDITQDVFIKLFASPPPPSIRNPRAYLFRMVHNLAIDTLRKKQCADMEQAPPAGDPTDSIALRLDLETAIAALSPPQREALSLHLTGGLTLRETADIMGISAAAVYRTYRRALKTLQILLDGGSL